MGITRRDFLKYCGISAAALGLSSLDLVRLEEALATTAGPQVIWLQGSGCTGCSMSFLNFINAAVGADPTDAGDILLNHINLLYHPNLMAAAGQSAAEVAAQAYTAGGYILAVEGGVPTAFGGRACWAWTYNGHDITFQQAVTDLSAKAAKVISIGTCAAFGGIPAAGSNPMGVKSVQAVTGKPTINIAGCPPHPDWIVYVIAQLLAGANLPLDGYGRPTALFRQTVHSQCPRNDSPETCLASQGCKGPGTNANCPTILWNNQSNWCVNANAPCYACTEPSFPGTTSLYAVSYNHEGTSSLNCSQCHDND